MQLPSKLIAGQQFKDNAVKAINGIIDYLKTQRIVPDNKTIKVNQMTAGVALSVISQNNGGNNTGNGIGKFPFQMYIGNDENENKVLKIHRGRIILNGDNESRIYVCFEDNQDGFLTGIPLPESQGNYHVSIFCIYDENTQSENQDFWEIRVCYTDSESQTTDFVNTCGFFEIYLGDIEVKENDNGQLSYSIKNQRIFSDFAVYDGNIDQNFKAHFELSTYPENGDILQQVLMPDTLVINGGDIYVGKRYFQCNKLSFTLQDLTQEVTFCAGVYLNQETANFLKVSDEEYIYYSEQNNMYEIPICKITTEYKSYCGIEQYIDNLIFISDQSGKVLLNANDQKPDFLESKIVYPVKMETALTEVESSIYTPEKQYIKGITVSSIISGNSSNVSSVYLYDRLYWDYSTISGYLTSNATVTPYQQLNNVSGALKWENAYQTRVTESDCKPGFLNDKLTTGQFIYKKIDSSGENATVKVWTRGMLAGYNIAMEDRQQDTESCYVQVKGYKTTVIGSAGVKSEVKNTDSGFTKQYTVSLDKEFFTVDNSISNVLDFDITGNKVKLKSVIGNRTGVITCNNGNWNYLQAPDEKAVLAYAGGMFRWAKMGTGVDLVTENGRFVLKNTCCSQSSSISVSSSNSSNSSSISVSSSISESDSNSSSVSMSVSSSVSNSISSSNSSSISVSNSVSNSSSISVSSSVSESSSISVSGSNSSSNSSSNSGSKSSSISVSNSVSVSVSISVSNSVSESSSNSSSKSSSISVSSSVSESSSKSNSISVSNSVSNSNSGSNSGSQSGSEQGDAIDCSDWQVYSPFEGAGNITGYGNYVTETSDCQGFVFHKSIYSFNGSYVNLTDCDYWSGDQECYQDEQTYTIWNGTWFDVWANCRTDSETGRQYIQVQLYGRDGYYNPALGPAIKIYNYGTYQLPHYNWDSDDCEYWSPEDGEQGQEGGWYGERSVVTSYPTFYVTIIRRNNN